MTNPFELNKTNMCVEASYPGSLFHVAECGKRAVQHSVRHGWLCVDHQLKDRHIRGIHVPAGDIDCATIAKRERRILDQMKAAGLGFLPSGHIDLRNPKNILRASIHKADGSYKFGCDTWRM